MTKLWGSVALIAALLLGVSIIHLCVQTTQADSPCVQHTQYTGTIDSIDRVHNTVSLYDPQQKTVDPVMGRVNMVVHTNATTHIYIAHGNACQSASFKDLRPGQKLAVWPQGQAIVQMFPLPLRAATIVVTS
ncbi:hypothetical protein [Dictyobacter aurantiacus]|uniref:DUF5666 domain-containing protein n=1 Tax=Dictyobacter aurantiacus TaxID=1936993 RepID=A0A401ZCL1_9CHLR|nr:hypothetical protein [Dictyobacter aurantiacus]GCE04617.1 hypothetical protein KDAU_19460 [Dictyobacter aurantiacus]